MHDDSLPSAPEPLASASRPGRSSREDSADPERIRWEPLEAAALAARDRAHAPYSKFHVGAALLTRDGTILVGCNVENRTFGLCVCAERNAVVQAIAGGHHDFVAIAVATDTSPPAVPCGLCLETLSEFASDLPIRSVNPAGEVRDLTLRGLFPSPFEWPDSTTEAAE